MSVLNKKPYIETVLESLTDAQKASLKQLVNGSGTKIFRSFINVSAPITTSDKGVSLCILEAKDAVLTGYLLFLLSYGVAMVLLATII